MNNLAYWLARIYYNLTGQSVSAIPTGYKDSWWAERIQRHIAGLSDNMQGGKSTAFFLELWFYYRTGQSYRLAIGDRPAWFWLSKLYAVYTGGNSQAVLVPASAEFWADKLLSILTTPEIRVEVNGIETADNGTFAPGTLIQSASAQYTVTAFNTGAISLTLQNATRSGDVSAVTAWSSNTVMQGQSAACTITLDTSATGAQSGYFEFVTNDPSEDVYRVNVSYSVITAADAYALKETAGLIQYLRLNEIAGVTANDTSPENNDGVYLNGVTLAATPAPFAGDSAPLFDGSNDCINLYSAAFVADFNPALFSIVTWVKVANAGIWTDGLSNYILRISVDGADSNSALTILKFSTNNTVRVRYAAGGVSKQQDITTSTLDFFVIAVTVNKALDRMRVSYNGVQVGSDLTGLGVWAGAIDSRFCNLGTYNTSAPAASYNGYLSNHRCYNVEKTQAQILNLAS